MQNLDNYLESENESRKILINNLNSNMKNIQSQLQNPLNFRRFFWTPDLNVYGFASKTKINETIGVWSKLNKKMSQQQKKDNMREYLQKVKKNKENEVLDEIYSNQNSSRENYRQNSKYLNMNFQNNEYDESRDNQDSIEPIEQQYL